MRRADAGPCSQVTILLDPGSVIVAQGHFLVRVKGLS